MSDTSSQSTLGNSQLDATIDILLGGPAAGDAGSAVAGWLTTLQDHPQLASIRQELERLHAALKHEAPDDGVVARSLRALGEQTTAAAAQATPDAQDKLRQIGQALGAVAAQLSA